MHKNKNTQKASTENQIPDRIITPVQYLELSDCEQKKWEPVKDKYEKVPPFCFVSLAITVACIIIYIIACISENFADFFNIYISSVFRWLLAQITNIFVFSIAEVIIILIPVILFISMWYFLKYRCKTKKASLVSSLCILSVAAMLLSSFILTFGTGYRGSSLDKKLEIERNKISAEELYLSAEYLIERINELSSEIYYGDDDFSQMPYSFDQMNENLLDAYEKFSKEHDFIKTYRSRLKPVALSEPMSYTHITGVYSFFTGEANINANFPDYTIPYTAAHELAHQRGIAREDEANMIAFLVCLQSDDKYIQYSAYLNMYEYISNALYKADKELYYAAFEQLSEDVYREEIAYSRFFKKYRDSSASAVSGAVNDVYLKAQGTEGKKSYGMVVDLTVAYFKSEKYIEN